MAGSGDEDLHDILTDHRLDVVAKTVVYRLHASSDILRFTIYLDCEAFPLLLNLPAVAKCSHNKLINSPRLMAS